MAEATGADGSVTFSAGNVVNVHGFNLSYKADALEKTDFVDSATGVRTYLPGLKDWSGTYVAWLDDTAVQKAPGDTAATITMTATTGRTFAGSAIVTSLDFGVVVDGMTEVTTTFQGSGALTIA